MENVYSKFNIKYFKNILDYEKNIEEFDNMYLYFKTNYSGIKNMRFTEGSGITLKEIQETSEGLLFHFLFEQDTNLPEIVYGKRGTSDVEIGEIFETDEEKEKVNQGLNAIGHNVFILLKNFENKKIGIKYSNLFISIIQQNRRVSVTTLDLILNILFHISEINYSNSFDLVELIDRKSLSSILRGQGNIVQSIKYTLTNLDSSMTTLMHDGVVLNSEEIREKSNAGNIQVSISPGKTREKLNSEYISEILKDLRKVIDIEKENDEKKISNCEIIYYDGELNENKKINFVKLLLKDEIKAINKDGKIDTDSILNLIINKITSRKNDIDNSLTY